MNMFKVAILLFALTSDAKIPKINSSIKPFKPTINATNKISWVSSDPCGICKKPGDEIFWQSPFSRGVHLMCYNNISKNIEESLQDKLIHKIRSYDLKDSSVHVELIRLVDKKMNGYTSMKHFHDVHGKNELEKLYMSALLEMILKKIT